jgi:hypothetical protein
MSTTLVTQLSKSSGVRNSYKSVINALTSDNLLGGIAMQGHFLESSSATSIVSALNGLTTGLFLLVKYM